MNRNLIVMCNKLNRLLKVIAEHYPNVELQIGQYKSYIIIESNKLSWGFGEKLIPLLKDWTWSLEFRNGKMYLEVWK